MSEVIKNFRVEQFGLDNNRLDVLWDFVNPETALMYSILILRSQAISGPFALIAEVYNSVSYTDWEVDPDIGEVYYYKLQVKRRDTGEIEQETRPRRFEPQPDVLAREILRRSNLLLKEFIGVPVLYYPLRLSGNTRCPDCWDNITGQRIKSRCESCFDTGYVSGYYNPILMYLFIHEDPTAFQHNAETDEYPIRTGSALLPGNFVPNIGDLIVERYHDRWLVTAYSVNEKLRFTTTYNLRLHHVLETDVRYRVPIPEEDLFAKLGPRREYTRPYTLLP